MDKYAVIGNPIGHSKSPKIHRLFGEQLGHKITYEKLEATENTFSGVVEEFFRSGGKGVNVTLPFKGLAYEFSEVLGAHAKNCGAVNTLSFSEDGRVYGESTDGVGLITDLKNNNITIEERSVLVIGAGGTVLPGSDLSAVGNAVCGGVVTVHAVSIQPEFEPGKRVGEEIEVAHGEGLVRVNRCVVGRIARLRS